MSRVYKELNGKVSNVASRIVEDYYEAGFVCDKEVGSYAERELVQKLNKPHIKSLGFTHTSLTIPITTVSFSDRIKIRKVWDKLALVGITLNHLPSRRHSVSEVNRLIKEKKKELVKFESWDDVYNYKASLIYGDASQLVKAENAVILPYMKSSPTTAFNDNVAHALFGGLKPSKFLAKHIEHLIPNITDEYSAAISSTKDVKVHLTINPNIMINCTESATFSSCYKYTGEYHYSAQRLANTPDMLMVVCFDDDGRISYRNWVAVNETRDTVRSYQPYADINPKVMGEAITPIVNSFLLGDYDSKIVDGDDYYIEVGRDTHLDSSVTSTTASHGHWNNGDEAIVIGEAKDIKDGYFTSEPELVDMCECVECTVRHPFEELSEVAGNSGHVCAECEERTYEIIGGELIHIESCVYDVYGTPLIGEDAFQTHVTHDRSDELYPEDELVCTYDNETYLLPDEVYWSEETEEYYEHECNRDLSEA